MNNLFGIIISLMSGFIEGIIVIGFILALLILPALLNGGWIFYIFYALFLISIIYIWYEDKGDNNNER